MHIGFLPGYQVQQSHNSTECLVIDDQHYQQSCHCEWPSNFSLQDAVEQQVGEGHRHVGHITVVELNHCNILEEVLPQWHSLLDQALRNNLAVHQRPCVVHPACVNTRHEGSSQHVKQYAFEHENANYPETLQVFELDCILRIHLARLDQQTERIPQQPRVKSSSHTEMRCQAIGTHPRSALVLRLLIKTTLDHPPSNGPLQSSQTEQGKESVPHFGLQISLKLEDGKGNDEPIAQHHPHLPMEELHPIDRLKTLQSDLLIDCLVLDGRLVLVELNVPLLCVARVPFGIGTPVCHAEPRMGQPSIAAQHDHAEHSCC